jgi:hypothetical protein
LWLGGSGGIGAGEKAGLGWVFGGVGFYWARCDGEPKAEIGRRPTQTYMNGGSMLATAEAGNFCESPRLHRKWVNASHGRNSFTILILN